MIDILLLDDDRGSNLKPAQLVQALAGLEGDAYFSGLGVEAEGRWELLHWEATVGPRPPQWQERLWDYGRVRFINACVSAVRLVSLLDSQDKPQLQLAGTDLSGPQVVQVHWQRQPSMARYDNLPLPWPAYFMEVESGNRPSQPAVLQNYLIGSGSAPSFSNYSTAYQAFFYGNFSQSGASIPSRYGFLRLPLVGAYLRRLRLTPTHLEVFLGGDDLAGAALELIGKSGSVTKPVRRAARYRFPLRSGLDEDAWLYLKRGNRWLDYCALGSVLRGDSAERRGIEREQGVDQELEVDAFIAEGEGLALEFKRDLPADTNSKRNVLRTVAAFANTDGGTLVFGIDKSETTVVGVSMAADDVNARDALTDLVHNGLTSHPPVADPRWLDYGDKRLLVWEISPGRDVPYGVTLKRGDRPEYVVRRGASNVPARPEDIQAIVLERRSRPAGDATSAYPAVGLR